MQFKIGDWVVHSAHGTADLPKIAPVPLSTNYPQRSPGRVSCLKQGLFRDVREVVRDLTAWGWRKSYRPDRYATLAEDTAEPLSRMGDDG